MIIRLAVVELYFNNNMPASKNIFITGINGFVGKYLSEYLKEQGWRVSGMDRWPTCSYPGVSYFEGDILDTAALVQLLFTIRPQRIIHLAGISFPADADSSPRNALDVNIMGAASVLDAARQACPSSRILLVGSSKQYSDAVVSDAIAEETLCRPTSFYGISKYMAELIGLQYVRQYGLDVRCTRSFNHTGPGQPPRFVCSDWAKQVAEIALGKAEPLIRVGDISPAIDFSDVRDVVRAYYGIIEKGAAGQVYNVCSGRVLPLQELLAIITAKSGKKITVEQDQARLRMHKTSIKTIGDHSKLTRATGWEPEIPIEKTLDDLYRYWLSALTAPTV
jgi:GDP-4-dehydro-6-deoxy-D-mannose reductase